MSVKGNDIAFSRLLTEKETDLRIIKEQDLLIDRLKDERGELLNACIYVHDILIEQDVEKEVWELEINALNYAIEQAKGVWDDSKMD